MKVERRTLCCSSQSITLKIFSIHINHCSVSVGLGPAEIRGFNLLNYSTIWCFWDRVRLEEPALACRWRTAATFARVSRTLPKSSLYTLKSSLPLQTNRCPPCVTDFPSDGPPSLQHGRKDNWKTSISTHTYPFQKKFALSPTRSGPSSLRQALFARASRLSGWRHQVSRLDQ